MKILIIGLSGSGKTTLAKKLHETPTFSSFFTLNGDDVRSMYNDWDFSINGRIRQSIRISYLSDKMQNVIIDFIAPLEDQRKRINYDVLIWMNTKQHSIFPDTDALFEPPTPHITITELDYDLDEIITKILTITSVEQHED